MTIDSLVANKHSFPLKIERWWKELHERLETFFKDQLNWLKDQAHYDPNDEVDRLVFHSNRFFLSSKYTNTKSDYVNYNIRYTAKTSIFVFIFVYILNCPRMLLAFIMVPVVQKEVDSFKDTVWNTHRIRAQRNTILPDGIPNHIHSFPEQ